MAHWGHVHTETFSGVFVLFQVMSWLFSIPLRTVNNTKTQENVSVCTGPDTHPHLPLLPRFRDITNKYMWLQSSLYTDVSHHISPFSGKCYFSIEHHALKHNSVNKVCKTAAKGNQSIEYSSDLRPTRGLPQRVKRFWSGCKWRSEKYNTLPLNPNLTFTLCCRC